MNKRLMLVPFALTAAVASAEVKPLEGPWLAKGEKLVCFGDSITANKGYYMKPLTAALEAKGVTVVNAGVPGDKTPMALTRIAAVAAEKPDAVMIFFGANDSVIGRGRWRDEPTVDPSSFRDNLVWMVHYLRTEAGVKKFSIVVPAGCFEGAMLAEFGPVFMAYRQAAREAADRANAVLVPLDIAFERTAKSHTPNEKGLLLTWDGVHFSPLASSVAAEAMLTAWNMK